MCQKNSESINHLFLHCSIEANLWNVFLLIFGLIQGHAIQFKGIFMKVGAHAKLVKPSTLDLWTIKAPYPHKIGFLYSPLDQGFLLSLSTGYKSRQSFHPDLNFKGVFVVDQLFFT